MDHQPRQIKTQRHLPHAHVNTLTPQLPSPSRATALKLASQGATLALCDINPAGLASCLDDLRRAAGGAEEQHTTFQCDVASSAAVEQTVQAVLSRYGGPLHLVFNCAGVNPTALAIGDTTDAYFDKLVNTNLRGPYNVTRAVEPHLEKGAAIVNVASVAGLRASRGFSVVSFFSSTPPLPPLPFPSVLAHSVPTAFFFLLPPSFCLLPADKGPFSPPSLPSNSTAPPNSAS